MCVSPLRTGSLFPTVLWFPCTSFPGLLKMRHFRGFSFRCWTQRSRCLMWGTLLSLLEGKFHILGIPSQLWVTMLGVGSRARLSFYLSYLLDMSLLSLLWRHCSSSSQILFRGSDFICSYKFTVAMGGSDFRVFLHCHLEPLLHVFSY